MEVVQVEVPVIAAAGALLVLVLCGVRVVPPGQRGVVTRAGRLVRVADAGPMLLVPLLDRLTLVRTAAVRIDPLVVLARTGDGAEVRLVGSLLCRVSDPAAALDLLPDPASSAADAVERRMAAVVARSDLHDLAQGRSALTDSARDDVQDVLDAWGVELLDLDVTDVEVRLTPTSARLLG